MCAASGVPPGLLLDAGDGTSQRESYRRFVAATCEPIAALVAQELSEKLEVPISLSFASLMAGDIAGRARGFGAMVKAGMDPGKAAGLAGLLQDDD